MAITHNVYPNALKNIMNETIQLTTITINDAV